MDRPRFNEDGVGSLHLYAPWWLDNKQTRLFRAAITWKCSAE
jgi:hypothetical protein